jgi:hypothetical protein
MQSAEVSNQKDYSFPWKNASILYGISYIPLLLSANSLFWDDWVTVDHETGNIPASRYSSSGSAPWRHFVEQSLLQSSPILFRVVGFFAFFISGYFFFHVLRRVRFLTQNQVITATLVFLVLPVNSARIALINNSYVVSYLLFFFGWYLLATSDRKSIQLLSLFAFFISYTSLPVITFTLLPILYLIFLAEPKSIKDFFKGALRATPLIALPVVYLVARQMFWPPMGGYAKAYTPQFLGIARALFFVAVCSLPFIYGVFFAKWRSDHVRQFLVSIGVFSVSIAAFPYMLGGHLVDISDWLIAFVPNFSDWDSRHQLLLPFGISLIVASSMKLDKLERLTLKTYPALTTLLAVFVVLNFTFAQEYFLDSKKQDAVIEAMATNPDLKSVRSVYIDDQAVRFNARGRLIRSYEWEGMLEKALGTKSITVSYLQYPNCTEFKPDAILHINSPNGRLESTLRGKVAIDLSVERIDPCSN